MSLKSCEFSFAGFCCSSFMVRLEGSPHSLFGSLQNFEAAVRHNVLVDGQPWDEAPDLEGGPCPPGRFWTGSGSFLCFSRCCPQQMKRLWIWRAFWTTPSWRPPGGAARTPKGSFLMWFTSWRLSVKSWLVHIYSSVLIKILITTIWVKKDSFIM